MRQDDVPTSTIWDDYLNGKMTIAELSVRHGVSASTIKRRLRLLEPLEWVDEPLAGHDVVHMDVTYWGRNFGVLLVLSATTGRPLHMRFVKHETKADYVSAIKSLQARGLKVDGVVLDGLKVVFKELTDVRFQMCQFHMCALIRRKITQNPKTEAGKALQELMRSLSSSCKEDFSKAFEQWKERWREFLSEQTESANGRKIFTHKRLRSASASLSFFMPYLFTFEEVPGMPKTNNRVEGTFTDLKKNLNCHCGMGEVNRKRFICGFFLALKSKSQAEE